MAIISLDNLFESVPERRTGFDESTAVHVEHFFRDGSLQLIHGIIGHLVDCSQSCSKHNNPKDYSLGSWVAKDQGTSSMGGSQNTMPASSEPCEQAQSPTRRHTPFYTPPCPSMA